MISEINIGPNPTKGILNISNSSAKKIKVQLSEINGKLILEKTFESETSIDLSAYSNGIYFVKVIDNAGKELASKKIVKQ